MKTITREQIEARLKELGWEHWEDCSLWSHRGIKVFDVNFTCAMHFHASLSGPLFPTSGEPHVKELEWREMNSGDPNFVVSITPDGDRYYVEKLEIGWHHYLNDDAGTELFSCDSLTHGKYLCQKDFETRVKSCLK